jgi:signal transduction histidine kinase
MQNIERAADAGEAHEYFSVAFWLHRMKAISAWRLVAISRLVLALFALLAIYIDPTQPTRSSETVYLILAAYVVYSGALAAILERFAASHPAAYLVHGIDILTFGAVIRLTDGPTSPFFVFLTFALFAATIRWGWRGAAFTTLATVGIYGTLAALSDDLMNDFNRVVMRSVYLVVAGVLFAYFGSIIERMRLGVANLAGSSAQAWLGGDTPLASVLRRAAVITRAARAMAVWHDETGPLLRIVELEHGVVSHSESANKLPEETGRSGGGAEFWRGGQKLPDWLIRGKAETMIVAPLPGGSAEGFVLFIDCEETGEDLLPLASVAAARIGYEIAEHDLRQRLIEAAKAEERERLAQDIHDDLLQSMAAVSIQLASLPKEDDGETAERLAQIRSIIGEQQDKLRTLVREATGEPMARKTFRVAGRLCKLLVEMQAQWACTIGLSISPLDLVMSEKSAKGLFMLISEAIANGVRHGRASRFEIHLEGSRTLFTLTVQDDGKGLEVPLGTFEHETVLAEKIGSTALRRRVQALGWRLSLDNSLRGLAVTIRGALE